MEIHDRGPVSLDAEQNRMVSYVEAPPCEKCKVSMIYGFVAGAVGKEQNTPVQIRWTCFAQSNARMV